MSVTPQPSLTAATTLLTLHDLCAGYRAPVVGPISLQIQAGEIVGLSGVNGSGKTTLLKAITGQARIFAGSVQRQPGLQLAYLRQHPERPPELPLTGSEVIALAQATIAQQPERLAALSHLCLDEMSGGQYQLLKTWCALAGPAQLVLLDEPTNNLDQDAMDLLLTQLRTLAPTRAVLLVSHEQLFLTNACSRLVQL